MAQPQKIFKHMKMRLLLLTLCLPIQLLLAQEKTPFQELMDEGIHQYELNQYDVAIEYYEKALEIDKKSQAAHYELSYTYYTMGKMSKSYKHAKKAIKIGGEYTADAYVLKGNVQNIKGRFYDAMRTFKKGLRAYPDYFLLHYNLAFTAYLRGDIRLTKKAIARSIELNPMYPGNHFLLGFVKLDEEKNTPALMAFTYFLMLEPSSKRAKEAMNQVEKLVFWDKTTSARKKFALDNTYQLEVEIKPKEEDQEKNPFIDMEKEKKELARFSKRLHVIYTEAIEKKRSNDNLIKNFYMPFYADLLDKQHLEAFSYYINQMKDGEAFLWLQVNDNKVQAMFDFLNERS
jgi:tetratricopeptide (TPR) repeat protein